jgi:hypothetical protein
MRFAFLPLSMSLVLSLSATALAQSEERAPVGELESSRARARQLFEKGGVAFDARRLEEARVALAESFELHPSYDTAGLLGQTEIELGLYPKAARHLDYCLRHFPTGENLELLERVRVGFSAVQNQVGTLRIQVSPPGAEVSLDGVSIGSAPLEAKVFVEPGKHLVRATRAGMAPVERAIAVRRGDEEVVTLDLTAEGSAAPVESPAAPAAVEPTSAPVTSAAMAERNWLPAYVLGGVTLASLVTSLAFRASASNEEDEVERLGGEVPDEGCAGTAASGKPCQDLAAAVDRHDQKAGFANVALVVAGVGAAATAGYITFVLLEPNESVPVKASVGFAGASGGLFVSGRF